MGTSLAMIDRHYGHLASDGREHAVALLDAFAREKLVDAGWTPAPPPENPLSNTQQGTSQREIAVAWTLGGRRSPNATRQRSRKEALSRENVKPSDGLEPSTPSLPCAAKRLPRVATGADRPV